MEKTKIESPMEKNKRNYWKIAGIILIVLNLFLIVYSQIPEKTIEFGEVEVPVKVVEQFGKLASEQGINTFELIDVETGRVIQLEVEE